MRLTHAEHTAITFDHLLTFIAQCDLGNVRMDVTRLRDLLVDAANSASTPVERALFHAALDYLTEVE